MCLQLSMDKHDWPHARERCQRHGGDLVQIRSAEMQGSIIEKIRQSHSHIKTGFWIGASDQHHEGLWEWVAGQLATNLKKLYSKFPSSLFFKHSHIDSNFEIIFKSRDFECSRCQWNIRGKFTCIKDNSKTGPST